MSQGDASPQRKPRRFLLVAAIVLLAGIAGIVLFREAIASRLAAAYLESQGVFVHGLTVTRLTPGGAEAQHVVLGRYREASARDIALRLSWSGLQPRVTGIDITGLRLNVDLTGDADLLGSLQPLVERLTASQSAASDAAKPTAETGDTTPAPPVPPVALNDAKVIMQTPSGPMSADLNGGLGPSPDGGLVAQAVLHLDSELGAFRAQLDAERTPAGRMRLNAELTDGRLAWRNFTVDAFHGLLSAEDPGSDDPRLAGSFELSGLSYTPAEGPPLKLAAGGLKTTCDFRHCEVTARLDGDGEHLDAKVSASLPAPEATAQQFRLTLEGEAESAGGLTRLLPLRGTVVTGGRLTLDGEGKAVPPAGAGQPETLAALLDVLPRAELDLKGDAILSDVSLANGTEGLSAHLPLVARGDGEALTLTLSEDAEVRVERPALANLQRLGLPADVLPLVTSGLTLTLKAGGDLPFALTTTPAWPPRKTEIAVAARGSSDQGLQITADIKVAANLGEDLRISTFEGRLDAAASLTRFEKDGRTLEDLSLSLPLEVAFDSEKLHLNLSEAGTLAVGRLGGSLPLRLESPLQAKVTEAQFDADFAADSRTARLRLEDDGTGLQVTGGDAPLTVRLGRFSLAFGSTATGDADFEASSELLVDSLDLPERGLSSGKLSAKAELDRSLRPTSGRFGAAAVQAGAPAPPTAPLKLDGSFTRKGDGYDLAAHLWLDQGETALADLTGRYGDDGRARLEAATRPLTFSPNGLQPKQISPALDTLENVHGTLNAKATLLWPRDPVREQGQLTLSGFSFGGPAQVEGLDLSLALDSLQPPASAAGQRLTIQRLEAGVPVDNIEVTFSIAPKPQLDIEAGGFDLGGARWHIDPTGINPAAARNQVVLGTDALDLATFFKLIEVNGLSGSGTLKGRLPIAFAEGDVIVEDGRFEAQGPGRLSIRFEALRSALSGGGETVELAVKALEDFHYENLTVTLDKTADNDATVRLSTLGSNPEVLDGQLFQFNINLESNLTSVLEALRQGYSLSDDALRRAWRLHE